ncbi:MAG: hypothetical protein LBE36_02645 [Flavobacteriaceae bacterium]|nr:hypothetical protein [Flavobacteriaceae bacterium]
MKKYLIVAILGLFFNFGNAQAWEGTGDQKLQIGLSPWGYGTGITATYDYGITDLISVGAGGNFYFDGNHHHKGKDDYDKFFIFGRLNFHLRNLLDFPSAWDLYPGVDVGVIGNTFGLGVHLGARYFFTDKFGVFLEAGNNGSLGVSINF